MTNEPDVDRYDLLLSECEGQINRAVNVLVAGKWVPGQLTIYTRGGVHRLWLVIVSGHLSDLVGTHFSDLVGTEQAVVIDRIDDAPYWSRVKVHRSVAGVGPDRWLQATLIGVAPLSRVGS